MLLWNAELMVKAAGYRQAWCVARFPTSELSLLVRKCRFWVNVEQPDQSATGRVQGGT